MTRHWTSSLLLMGACCLAEPPVWHVSPDGDDRWSGRLANAPEAGADGPLATLGAALEASRRTGGDPRRIVLSEGRFHVEQTLQLDGRDSGLRIEGAGPGRTIVYGGRQVTGWERSGEQLWSAPLPADLPAWSFRVLVVNDAIRDRARFPEKGYLEHETTFKVRWMSTAGGGWERKPSDLERTTMQYKPGDISADLRIGNAEVTVCHMWDESTVAVAAHDPAARTLTFASPCGHPPGAFGVQRYAVWNTREGMTRPGQWYLDRGERRVYYWPIEGEDMSRALVVAPRVETVIQITGKAEAKVGDVALRGLTLSATEAPLRHEGFGASNWPGAIQATHADRLQIEDVEVAHAGGWGVREWGGSGLVVRNCRLHHLGGGGIRFGSGARLEENAIHSIGLVSASAIGIMGGGTGSVVRRNVIHDTPYSGMSVGGTETVIEENLLYRCMLVHHDGAAIYMGGGKRCIIRRNVARDMAESGPGYGVSAYYLDEKCQECVVAENVSINIARPSHNHMTLNCTLRDNVFITDGDMRLSFARCAGHKVINNTFHYTGKLQVTEPDAVAEWTGNRLVVRDEAGGRVHDDFPRAPFTPRDKPRYQRVTPIGAAPTIDGTHGDDEWPSGGTSLNERPDQRSARGAPTSIKIHADRDALYIAANVVTMFPDQRRLGTEWGKDEGIELVLEAKDGEAAVVHVLRGFTDGTLSALQLGGATAAQADAFQRLVRYAASVDKQIWRCEWAVPLAALGVGPGEKALVPFNLTVYRSEDDLLAQFAGTLGETWDLALGGRLMLNWDDGAPPQPAALRVPTVGDMPEPFAAWPGTAVSLAQSPSGAPLAATPGSATVLRCGEVLLVRVVVPVADPAQVTTGNVWRTDDGAEVCLRGASADGQAVTWVVRGFASGAWELSDEAGAAAEANAALRHTVQFSARRTAAGWEGEWRLPLGGLGVRRGAPTPFNLGVYRSADAQWINWIGTSGPTWRLERAGVLQWD